MLPVGGGVDVLPQWRGVRGIGVRPKIAVGAALAEQLRQRFVLRLGGDVLLLQGLVLVLGRLILLLCGFELLLGQQKPRSVMCLLLG